MVKIIKIFADLFSTQGIIFFPKKRIAPANKKNLDPLVRVETIIKTKKLKCINPLEIVSSLKGTGVNPAMINNITQAQKPFPIET